MNYSEQFAIQSCKKLSSTAQTFSIEGTDQDELILATDTTLLTSTIESVDFDEINMHIYDTTTFTKTTESVDNDEIHLSSTLQTNTIETNDNDYVHFDTTALTETTEPTDDDFIYAELASTLKISNSLYHNR